MLCFGSVSGQKLNNQEAKYLQCTLDWQRDYKSEKVYPLSYLLLGIISPGGDFSGDVYFYQVTPTENWKKIYRPDFTKDLIVFNIRQGNIYVHNNYPEMAVFKSLDRKSLTLVSNNNKKISDCLIISESIMLILQRELINQYNEGNQI